MMDRPVMIEGESGRLEEEKTEILLELLDVASA
jgi:hypothetical protein